MNVRLVIHFYAAFALDGSRLPSFMQASTSLSNGGVERKHLRKTTHHLNSLHQQTRVKSSS